MTEPHSFVKSAQGMPTNGYTIRPATLDDVPDLVALRRLMHEAMGYGDHPRLDDATDAIERALRRRLADGSLRSWVAVAPNGCVAATGS
ncbi:MAG TPA: hypothetical protein DEP84_00610, partial [Chloroflexi bacterium]|nr:hypothetical protein [Chloroflexota bacterium]